MPVNADPGLEYNYIVITARETATSVDATPPDMEVNFTMNITNPPPYINNAKAVPEVFEILYENTTVSATIKGFIIVLLNRATRSAVSKEKSPAAIASAGCFATTTAMLHNQLDVVLLARWRTAPSNRSERPRNELSCPNIHDHGRNSAPELHSTNSLGTIYDAIEFLDHTG